MGIIAQFPQSREKQNELVLASCQELLINERHRVLHLNLSVGSQTPPICHVHATKRIVVLEGCADIQMDTGTVRVFEGQDFVIEFGTTHQIQNRGKIPLIILDVRCGTYLDDDDALEI